MVPIRVFGGRVNKKVYALLDEGSTVTLIKKNLVRELKLSRSKVNISLKGVGD